MPVVPATQEVDTGGSLEPQSLRLQEALTVPLNFSLGNRGETVSKKKKKSIIFLSFARKLTFTRSLTTSCMAKKTSKSSRKFHLSKDKMTTN